MALNEAIQHAKEVAEINDCQERPQTISNMAKRIKIITRTK